MICPKCEEHELVRDTGSEKVSYSCPKCGVMTDYIYQLERND